MAMFSPISTTLLILFFQQFGLQALENKTVITFQQLSGEKGWFLKLSHFIQSRNHSLNDLQVNLYQINSHTETIILGHHP